MLVVVGLCRLGPAISTSTGCRPSTGRQLAFEDLEVAMAEAEAALPSTPSRARSAAGAKRNLGRLPKELRAVPQRRTSSKSRVTARRAWHSGCAGQHARSAPSARPPRMSGTPASHGRALRSGHRPRGPPCGAAAPSRAPRPGQRARRGRARARAAAHVRRCGEPNAGAGVVYDQIEPVTVRMHTRTQLPHTATAVSRLRGCARLFSTVSAVTIAA